MNENASSEAKVERALRRFFRQEMPTQFPPFVPPTTTPRSHAVSSPLTWTRCLIALSLAGFFATYLTLADSFHRPQPSAPGVPLESGPMIGSGGRTPETIRPKVEIIPMNPIGKK